MWKAFTVPAEMFAHTMELFFPNQRLELLRMVDQQGKALVQRNLAWISSDVGTILMPGSHAGLLFRAKEPRRAKHTPPDQYSIDPGFTNSSRDVVKALNVPIPQ